jgi:replication factor A1
MGDENYDRIIGRLAKSSGLEESELERRVEAKRAKLSGLISKEGAAQIIAAELGVSFDNEKMKINELLPGMKKAKVTGKVIRLFPVREFTRNGKESKVANFVIADETSNIKVVLWDTNHISLIERKEVVVDDVIEIANGSVREQEVHLGSFSDLKKSDEVFETVNTERKVDEKKISDFKIADNVKVRAFIVQMFEPRFFEVCPQCSKKVGSDGVGAVCDEHGSVTPERRSLINIVLDDGTENIRAVLFHEALKELGLDVETMGDKEKFEKEKDNWLGKEMSFSGAVRKNRLFENFEFVVDGVNEINLDSLIKELEAK